MSVRGVVAVIAGVLFLGVMPSQASADVEVAFEVLARDRPGAFTLVPTTAPASLQPLDETLLYVRRADTPGYTIGILKGRTRQISLFGAGYPSVKAALKLYRSARYKARATRVRGKRGYLLTSKRARRSTLLWAEGGTVLALATSTPKTISVSALQQTADGLDRLEGAYTGRVEFDETTYADVRVAVTSRTVSTDLDFRIRCTSTVEPGVRSGTGEVRARAILVPRQGGSFSFDLAPRIVDRDETTTWQGTVSGALTGSGGTVSLRATGLSTEFEQSCDTGPLSLTLAPVK